MSQVIAYQAQQWASTARNFNWHRLLQIFLTMMCICIVVSLVMVRGDVNLNWLNLNGYELNLKFSLDQLSVVMLLVVGVIGATVYRYASRYLLSDTSRARFLTQVVITLASVMFFIISGNLLTAFIGWQLIGLNLYILLNHYHYQSAANRAAKKKFIINRIGDMCFLLAIILCYRYFGTTDYDLLGQEAVIEGKQSLILGLIFIAIMTKSAQFPFHIWLPDTMQAPTPVSALMHAGVINSGGILLARLSPLFNQTNVIAYVIVLVGIVTLITGSMFKLTQSDVKKQLAYSTMSQMGYMVLQSGLGCFSAAIFHLIAHGFYKAYLFLNAGNALRENRIHKKARTINYITTIIAAMISVTMLMISQQMISNQAIPILIWAFIGISVHNFIINLFKEDGPLIYKAVLIIACQILLSSYLFAFKHFELLTGLIEQPIISNTIQYSLITILLFGYLASIHLPVSVMHSTVVGLKFYQLSKNKLYIETFLRRVILKPIRLGGERLNDVLVKSTLGKFGIFLSLVIPIFMVLISNNVDLNIIACSSMFMILLSTFLLMANRAETLKMMMLFLFFSQLLLVLLNIIHASYEKVNQMTMLLIPYSSIFLGIWLLTCCGSSVPVCQENQNKLTPWGTYLMVLLFMLLGLPGTFSFNVWFQLIAHFTESPSLLVLILLSNIMQCVVVLHTLQEYVFNLKQTHQMSKAVTPAKQVMLVIIIILNLLYANFSQFLST